MADSDELLIDLEELNVDREGTSSPEEVPLIVIEDFHGEPSLVARRPTIVLDGILLSPSELLLIQDIVLPQLLVVLGDAVGDPERVTSSMDEPVMIQEKMPTVNDFTKENSKEGLPFVEESTLILVKNLSENMVTSESLVEAGEFRGERAENFPPTEESIMDRERALLEPFFQLVEPDSSLPRQHSILQEDLLTESFVKPKEQNGRTEESLMVFEEEDDFSPVQQHEDLSTEPLVEGSFVKPEERNDHTKESLMPLEEEYDLPVVQHDDLSTEPLVEESFVKPEELNDHTEERLMPFEEEDTSLPVDQHKDLRTEPLMEPEERNSYTDEILWPEKGAAMIEEKVIPEAKVKSKALKRVKFVDSAGVFLPPPLSPVPAMKAEDSSLQTKKLFPSLTLPVTQRNFLEEPDKSVGDSIGEKPSKKRPPPEFTKTEMSQGLAARVSDGMKNLPVWQQRFQIVDTVRKSSVTVISGATGSGKSALIPLLLRNDMMMNPVKGEKCNIIVAMPRRIAAISLCNYVCNEMACPLGSEVGYHVGMVPALRGKRTKILYCTTGVLLNKLCRDEKETDEKRNALAQFSHVVIDEVHERSEEIDYAMLLVKLALISKDKIAKVIIMSATMEAKPILNYFKDEHLLTAAPFVQITGDSPYPVREQYLEDVCMSLPNFTVEKPFVKEVLMDLVLRHIEIEYLKRGSNKNKGAALIFLPGLENIELMMEKISTDYPNRVKGRAQWEICPLHSLIPSAVQGLVFRSLRDSVRRIVLATNIAESSITVPYIDTVYDFCLTKKMVTDTDTKMSFLQSQWATKSSCDQRKGRAGRVQAGVVIRLVPHYFYQDFASHPEPEMLCVPVTASILRSKVLDLPLAPLPLVAQAVSPPSEADAKHALLLLKEKGALSLYSNGQLRKDDGDLTFFGQICSRLPLPLTLVRLIYFAFAVGLLDDGIVLACIINVRNIFAISWQGNGDGFFAKKLFDSGMRSDCLASFCLFRDWMFHCVTGLFPEKNLDSERQYYKKYALSKGRLEEVRLTVYEIRKRMSSMGMYTENLAYYSTPFEGDCKWELLIKVVIAGAFYPDYVVASPALTEGDSLEVLAEMASLEVAKNAGCDPLRSFEIAIPGRTTTCMPIFYENQLRRYLQAVTKTDASPSIFYRGNRAVVEFQRSLQDESTGNISLVVELLLRQTKMSRHGNRNASNNFSTVTDLCGEQLLATNPDIAAICNVPSGRTPWLQIDYSESQKGIPLPTVFSQDATIDTCFLTVTQMIDECSFFARVYTQTPDPLISLDAELEKMVALDVVRKTLPSDSRSLIGQAILAPLKRLSGRLVRGKVLQTDREFLEIFFVDYGVIELVAWALCRIVLRSDATESFWRTPGLAVECRLPPHVTCTGSVKDMRDYFRKTKEQLSCTISQRVTGAVILSDVRTVAEDGTESSLLQKMEEENLLDIYSGPVPTANPFDVSAYTIPGRLITPVVMDDTPVQFGNPVSSFEISRGQYRWVYRMERFAQVHFESVNTVLLRKQNPDPVNYVLISGEAVVSMRKNTVVSAETTLMPHIPSMAAILCGLFAPVFETRMDPDRECPLGFYCGMGTMADDAEDEAYTPVFAAHDFMVFKDGTLDSSDLSLIRRARKSMNNTLAHARDLKNGREKGSAEDNIAITAAFQIENETLLLKLFRRVRRPELVTVAKQSGMVCPQRWTSSLVNSLKEQNPKEGPSLVDRITYDEAC